MKKRVLLAAPYHFDLYSLIEKNLSSRGFDVTTIVAKEFKYESFGQRAINFFMKSSGIDRRYKLKLKAAAQLNEWNKAINSNQTFDYALFLRADMFAPELISRIRSMTSKMIAYQYDGIERFPQIKKLLNYFDDFFVFDPLDYHNKPNPFKPTTNFYFDYEEELGTIGTSDSVFFLGSHQNERMIELLRLEKTLDKLGIPFDFTILSGKPKRKLKDQLIDSKIKLTKSYFSFEEYLKHVKDSGVIVDIVTRHHLGLSFRTFEALKYKKKLITTNEYISCFDFYHPNNIFILKKSSGEEQIRSFLQAPYFAISERIVNKYSFSNWVNYMFGIRPYEALSVPAFTPLDSSTTDKQ